MIAAQQIDDVGGHAEPGRLDRDVVQPAKGAVQKERPARRL
jgi:hypothetical protein